MRFDGDKDLHTTALLRQVELSGLIHDRMVYVFAFTIVFFFSPDYKGALKRILYQD